MTPKKQSVGGQIATLVAMMLAFVLIKALFGFETMCATGFVLILSDIIKKEYEKID